MPTQEYDFIVIGGGFYGCCLALFARSRFRRVLVVEAEADLMMRASWANQARVHRGYHYPRSYLTALRSSLNFSRFVADFPECIDRTFTKVYAIAKGSSKVSPGEFQRMCQRIGAPLTPAPAALKGLFDPGLIEEVYCGEEYAFDGTKLRELLRARLQDAGVSVLCRAAVVAVRGTADGSIAAELDNGERPEAAQVIACAYAGTNALLRASGLPLLPLKQELAELALLEAPEVLRGLGLTVMDGPFFSVMPFPALGLHSLSHVRYTPHAQALNGEAYSSGAALQRESQVPLMMRDAQRYLPGIKEARYVRSLFELKTVLTQNETDDGRPILFRKDYGLKGFSLAVGAKVDNVYDILDKLAGEECSLRS